MAQGTPFISQNENLVSIFDALNYIPNAVETFISVQHPRWQRPKLSKLAKKFKGDMSGVVVHERKRGNRLFTIPIQANDFPAATILSRTVNGPNLDIVFTDNTFDSIAIGVSVASESNCLAEVIAMSAGKVTLQCRLTASGATTFGSNDFLAGEGLSARGAWGNTQNRQNILMPFSAPTPYQNIIGQFDGGCEIDHDDFNTETYLSDGNGTKFYLMRKEVQSLQKMYWEYDAYMTGDYDMITSGNKPQPKSWINQIKTMGGFQLAKLDVMTLDDFDQAIAYYVSQGGFTGDQIYISCGTKYGSNVNTILRPFVLTAGTANVVGGATITGSNIFVYGYAGVNVIVEIDPFYDNPLIFTQRDSEGFTKRSNTAIWLCTAPVEMENGGGSMPFITDNYFSKTADVWSWVIPGAYDRRGNLVDTGASVKKSCVVNYTYDCTTQIMNPAAGMYHA